MLSNCQLLSEQSEPSVKPGLLKMAQIVEKLRLPIALLLVSIVFSGISIHALSPSINSQVYASQNGLINSADIYYIDQINKLRAEDKKQPLVYKAALETSASLKVRDMLRQGYWSHYSPSGESFADFIWRQNPASERVGENLARCFVTWDSAFSALVNSPTHYQIMVGDFTAVGVSELANPSDGCTYTVFHFAKN